MLVNLFCPRGIPADYRHMQGFGVNTYKWIDAQGETKLVKYHWMPSRASQSMTEEDAAAVQADDLGHASEDLHDAIERGEFPEWELLVQMMDDHDHPELDFDPLDDTKVWPEEIFPPKQVGAMQLNRNVENFFAENEQIRVRHRRARRRPRFLRRQDAASAAPSPTATPSATGSVPNYLQLPVNSPKSAHVGTNQRDGQMTYFVDRVGRTRT